MKKIFGQLIFTIMFYLLTVLVVNKILLGESFELLSLFGYKNIIAIFTFINDRKILVADLLIGVMYLSLFTITAFLTKIYKDKVKRPKSKRLAQFILMTIIVIFFVTVQFIFVNIKEFNNGSILSIHSFLIPLILFVLGMGLTFVFVFGNLGVGYVLPPKNKIEIEVKK